MRGDPIIFDVAHLRKVLAGCAYHNAKKNVFVCVNLCHISRFGLRRSFAAPVDSDGNLCFTGPKQLQTKSPSEGAIPRRASILGYGLNASRLLL